MTRHGQIHGNRLFKVQVQGQPRNLVVLKGNNSTRPFEAHLLVERFNTKHGTGLTIVSNKVADIALTTAKIRRHLPTFCTDESIAYEKPGTKLGQEIVFAVEGEPRLVLATGKYRGELDVALVALGVASADFKKDGNSIFLDIPDHRLFAVPSFPGPDHPIVVQDSSPGIDPRGIPGHHIEQYGWYTPDLRTGIPCGAKVVESPGARYLHRSHTSYVGLLVRSGGNYADGREIFVGCRASEALGVVAEVPNESVTKIEPLLSRIGVLERVLALLA